MPLLRRKNIEAAKELDRKLILIPLIFILLRVWGTIRFFVFLHSSNDMQLKDQINNTGKALIYLQVSTPPFFTRRKWSSSKQAVSIKRVSYKSLL